ncbi:hypothetical protein OH77DRAFT_1016313 [Trametes cingulata]|nr:hypothetical protein OH77DRAFT_1016313 [Trametes cingulata]
MDSGSWMVLPLPPSLCSVSRAPCLAMPPSSSLSSRLVSSRSSILASRLDSIPARSVSLAYPYKQHLIARRRRRSLVLSLLARPHVISRALARVVQSIMHHSPCRSLCPGPCRSFAVPSGCRRHRALRARRAATAGRSLLLCLIFEHFGLLLSSQRRRRAHSSTLPYTILLHYYPLPVSYYLPTYRVRPKPLHARSSAAR